VVAHIMVRLGECVQEAEVRERLKRTSIAHAAGKGGEPQNGAMCPLTVPALRMSCALVPAL
jgi:hypothetical protein